LIAAGFLRLRRGSPAAARPLLDEGLAIARRLQNQALIGNALSYLGEAANRERKPAVARPLLEEALAIARHGGGWSRWYIVLNHLAAIEEAEGAPDRARALYRECLVESRLHQDAHGTGLALNRLGSLELDQGDLLSARKYLSESLLTFRAVGTSEVAQVLTVFVGLFLAESQPLRALRLAAGTHALRRAQGAVLQPSEQARLEQQFAPFWAAVEETAARQAEADGETMTLEQLVEYALEYSEPNGVLSAREREVAALLARGYSNRQLAAELVISEGTAEVHVKHILRKLGFTSRGQITAWAVRQGLQQQKSNNTHPRDRQYPIREMTASARSR
jgi:non-specific serine/threonine protein kinase